jgi:DNA-binding NarL/FixJ family response regulator
VRRVKLDPAAAGLCDDLAKRHNMAATVLGIVKLEGQPARPCAFKRACDKARVSFQCESVQSAEEAIKYLSGSGAYRNRRRYPMPSLVVVDLDLEERAGLKVLTWIRSQAALRYLPVVVLSESKSQSAMKRAYDLRATSYLLKPRSFDELVRLIKSIDRYWLTLNQTPAP